jgi:hypothetical protein
MARDTTRRATANRITPDARDVPEKPLFPTRFQI